MTGCSVPFLPLWPAHITSYSTEPKCSQLIAFLTTSSFETLFLFFSLFFDCLKATFRAAAALLSLSVLPILPILLLFLLTFTGFPQLLLLTLWTLDTAVDGWYLELPSDHICAKEKTLSLCYSILFCITFKTVVNSSWQHHQPFVFPCNSSVLVERVSKGHGPVCFWKDWQCGQVLGGLTDVCGFRIIWFIFINWGWCTRAQAVSLVAAERDFRVPLKSLCSTMTSPPSSAFPLLLPSTQRSCSRRLCCLIAFQTLFYPSLDPLFISFPLFNPVAPAVSYTQQPATSLSNKCHKCFVRGSLKLFLINLYPVLMSFVTSNLVFLQLPL